MSERYDKPAKQRVQLKSGAASEQAQDLRIP